MPSLRINGKHGFNVQFSPFSSKHLACAASENYGSRGKGWLLILENEGSDHLKLRNSFSWRSGLLDVSWLKATEEVLVTSSCDGSIQVWNFCGSHPDNPVATFVEHTLDVSSIDSYNNFVASGSWDSTVKIWDINNQLSVNTFQACQGIIHSVKWSHTFPNLLVSASEKSHFILWDRSLPVPSIHKINALNSESLDCDWSHFNPYELVVAGNDGVLRLWDIRMLKNPHFVMRSSHVAPGKVKWSPHYPNIIATASYSLSTGIWDLKSGSVLETIRHHSAFILGLDFNKNVPGELADCGFDSLVHVFIPWSLHEFNFRSFLKNKL